MPVERRGAGRRRRDDQIDGRTTTGSAREGYMCRRNPAPPGLGRIDALDRADVDGPRTQGQRRQVVQPDRQGPPRPHTGCGVLSSRRKQRRCRSGSRDGHDVRRSLGREPQDSQRRSADRPISSTADPQALRFVGWNELVLLKPRASPGTMSSSSQTTTTHALLAQLAEQLTLNQRVVGSSPTGGTPESGRTNPSKPVTLHNLRQAHQEPPSRLNPTLPDPSRSLRVPVALPAFAK